MFVFESKSPFSTEIIEKACYKVAQKHPLLRMYIPESDRPLRFQKLDTIGIEVQHCHEKDLLSALHQDLRCPFKYGKNPLWRVTCLPHAEPIITNSDYKYQCVLLIAIDHAVGDFLSFVMMVGDFIKFISSIMGNNNLSDDVKSHPLPLSLEDSQHFYKRLSCAGRLLHYVATKMPALCIPLLKMASTPKHFCHPSVVSFLREEEQHVRNEPATVEIVYRYMNKQETKKLVKKSKDNGFSPAAALLASFFLALKQYADLANKQVKFAAATSLVYTSARKNKKEFCDLVNGVSFLYFSVEIPDDGNRFCEFANKCYFDRDAPKRHNEILPIPVELAAEMLKTGVESPEGRAQTLAVVTNLGRCKWLEMPESSPVRLERALPLAKNAKNFPNSPPFYIACYTLNDQMSWYMAYTSNKIRKSTAEEIADTMSEIIKVQTI